MRRFIWPWLGVEAALVLIVGFLLWSGLGEMLLGRHHEAIERLIGETPQAQVEGYLAAARRHDLKAALARWPEVPRLGPEYEARRQAVTQELAALQSLRYRVLEVEWWNTCCEPSPGPDSRNAGLARMWVEVAVGLPRASHSGERTSWTSPPRNNPTGTRPGATPSAAGSCATSTLPTRVRSFSRSRAMGSAERVPHPHPRPGGARGGLSLGSR